jgi:hypothetical protein
MDSIENGGDNVLIEDGITQNIAKKYALAPGNRMA